MKRSAVIAWASFAIAVAVSAAAGLLLPAESFNVTLIAPFGIVGAVLASRRPEHRIGWIFCAFAVTFAAAVFAKAFATAGLAADPEWPAARLAAWVYAWFWLVYVTQLELAFLLFPSGRFAGSRWRWLALAIIIANALVGAGRALMLGPLEGHPIDNPFGVAALAPAATGFGAVSSPLFLIGLLISLGSPFVRLPRMPGVEREQVKWVASGGVLLAGAQLLSGLLLRVGLDRTAAEFLSHALYALGVVAVPTTMGVAILRYRLYDIEVIIRRTLIYGSMLAVLAAAYLGGVVLVQSILRTFTSGSEIAVAASTLLTIALFQPLRSRMQRAIDQRFYRSRYDASRTVDAFAEQLRDEVDLEAVRTHLLATVRQTMAPAHASVWLRERGR
jgi:hypothetical protein